MSISIFKLLVLLAHICTVSILALRRQELILYSESNYTGLNKSFYENELDLQSNSEIGKIAKSVCVRSGVWVIAGLINGETTFDGWNSANIGELCSTWNVKNQTAVYTSIRRVAGSDLDRPSFTLYSEPNFRGMEVHVEEETDFRPENSSLAVASVAFTGRRHWNLFPHPAFAGHPNCIEAQDLFGHPMDVSFYTQQHLLVGSLKMDCPRPRHSPIRPRRQKIFPVPTSADFALITRQQQETSTDGELYIALTTTLGSHLLANTRVSGKSSSLIHPPTLNVIYREENK